MVFIKKKNNRNLKIPQISYYDSVPLIKGEKTIGINLGGFYFVILFLFPDLFRLI